MIKSRYYKLEEGKPLFPYLNFKPDEIVYDEAGTVFFTKMFKGKPKFYYACASVLKKTENVLDLTPLQYKLFFKLSMI